MKWSLAMLLICSLCSSIIAEHSDDWPMFQHDPQHSGYSSSRMPESLKEVWAYEGGFFEDDPHLVVSGENLFVAGDASLSALDINTGSVLWKHEYVMVSSNSPAISGNRIYAGGISNIFCFDAHTGEQIWNHDIGFLCLTSFPVVIDSLLYVGGGYPLTNIVETPENVQILERTRKYAHRVMCLDAETGEIVWEFYTSDYASYSPAYHDGRIYMNDGSREIYCLAAGTGELIWKKRIERSNFSSSLSLDGERIFVGTSDGIIALELTGGEVVWKFGSNQNISTTPAVAYNRVFAGSPDGTFYCFDAETGELIWKIKIESYISSSIIVADNKVAFGTADGILYIVKADSGEISESVDFGNCIRSLALSDGKLFVGQCNRNVSCLGGDYIESPPLESVPSESRPSEPKPSELISLRIPLAFILVLAILLTIMSMWYYRKQ